MLLKAKTISVVDLKIGDEFWCDAPYKHDYAEPDGLQTFAWRVIADPFASNNAQLFWESTSQECIVVPVEYMDGARGSRLYDPETQITIRRDIASWRTTS